MDAKEKRNLETALMQMGLAGLQANGEPSGTLVEQIANIVTRWEGYENRLGEWVDKHVFLRDLLNECDTKDRSEMYEAIVPKLQFKAKSLTEYEDAIALKAGNLISQRRGRVTGDAPRPVEVGGNKYAVAPRNRSTNVVATLSCWKCGKSAQFVGDTAAGAMIAGRKGGWTRDKAINKETCPDCAATEAAEEVAVLGKNQTMVILDRRRVN